jgi:hypothetical protein
MVNTTNNPFMDTERRNTINELIKLIDEFLEASNQTVHEEKIVEFVFIFFESNDFSWILHAYSDAAASALCFFATNNKISKEFTQLYGDDFYYLCQMLQKLVQFCNNISSSESNLARLDKAKWEIGQNSHLPIREMLKEKEIYELKLKHVREEIQRIRSQ